MKKRGWIALLCGLLAVCPALAEQTDGVVRVGEVTYDVQTVQNSLNAGYQLYESSGISLSAAQKQQLADSVLERFVGLGVLENQLRKEGQAEIDEQTRQALDEQARQTYEAAWQQMAEAIRSGTPDATDEQIIPAGGGADAEKPAAHRPVLRGYLRDRSGGAGLLRAAICIRLSGAL